MSWRSRRTDTLVLDNLRRNIAEREAGDCTLTSKPLRLWLGVTTRCNLRCIMCSRSYRPVPKVDMSLSEFECMARALFDTLLEVQICGFGEAYLHPDWARIEGILRQIRIPYGITTNGTLFNLERIRSALDVCAQITISLDAASDQVFRVIRCEGRLDSVLRALEAFRSLETTERRCTLIFQTTLQRLNLLELPKIVELAGQYDVDLVRVQPMISEGLPEHMRRHELEYDANTRSVLQEAIAIASESGVPLEGPLCGTSTMQTEARDWSSLESVPRTLSLTDKETLFGWKDGKCYSPWSEVSIAPAKNTVVLCCANGGAMGTLQDDDWMAVWNNERYRIVRATVNSHASLGNCAPDRCNMRSVHSKWHKNPPS